jgi:DNA invertase Pin-like site-specific DNA recombinase
MNRNKVNETHLRRSAYVYIRQSTKHQVLQNLESQQRQYELTRIAAELGYAAEQIVVIDDDLGISASGRHDRAGFGRLVSDVALGRAGIVLGLEVSRLARNNRDWYELLDLCAIKETLIADADGIYDPAAHNDRLLLGLKGTMSEAELHILKSRMLAGLRHKAQKGELRFRLVTGYEFDDTGAIVKSNDEQVVHLVKLVYAKMFELGSVNAVMQYLAYGELRIPRRNFSDGSVRWEKPYYRAIYLMLTNPIYAGTYVYGRSRVVHEIGHNGERKARRQVEKALADWGVILHDHHEAYVSREDFETIQRMIHRNRPATRDEASRALREGAALLQGIVRCGRCGRSMTVAYPRLVSRRKAGVYQCIGGYRQKRAGICQSFGGYRIDEAVVRVFLGALSRSSTEVQLAALRRLDEQQDTVLRQLELQAERARYEAGRAERQYNAVEPENRVVARTLETRWNDLLKSAQSLEQQVAARRAQLTKRLTESEERQLHKLARDLPRLWAHPNVTNRDRKALIRAAIEEVQLRKEERTVHVKTIWKGGAVTEVTVALNRLRPSTAASPDLIELVGELAKRHSDVQIARILARRGMKTPKKLTFSAHHVASLRLNYQIPCYQKTASNDDANTYTVEQTASLFKVSGGTVYLWLKLGILSGEQITAGAPWSIRITKADRERLTPSAPPDWLSLSAAAAELGVSKQTILNWVKSAKIPYVYAIKGRQSGLRIDVKSAPLRKQQRLLDQNRSQQITRSVV